VSNNHRIFFTLYMMEQDGRMLKPGERSSMLEHLSTCSACQGDLLLYQDLRARARQHLNIAPAPILTDKLIRSVQQRSRYKRLSLPLRIVAWVGLGLLAVFLIDWIFTFLLPIPASQPPGVPTSEVSISPVLPAPDEARPESLPTAFASEEGKTPVEPILYGDGSMGSWSPDGTYYFTPLLETPIPGSDRRTTVLHFTAAETGLDCPASETFIGAQGYQNFAWLDEENLLFIDRAGRALLFSPCKPGFLDLSDRFAEPLVGVGAPLISSVPARAGPLLLEASSAYWLLNPATLQARPLAEPVPSAGQVDSFSWTDDGRQLAVLQPIQNEPDRTRLTLLDLDSGQILRSFEVETGNEDRAPIIERIGPERLFVWGFGTGGPLLVDLSVEPARQERVLPELFGHELDYPLDVHSMGAFYSPDSNSFHIVVHVNLPGDQSIYLYHGESGQVEVFPGEGQALVIFPGDDLMLQVPLQEISAYEEEYDLIWADAPEQESKRLVVSEHSYRNDPYLKFRLLPDRQALLISSTQGISMVGLPGGETLEFWQLVGGETATYVSLILSPDGRSVIAHAHLNSPMEGEGQGSPLYWIPLDELPRNVRP
jgi:hypothetical protein